jgi:transcription factor C subunit 3
MIRRFRVRKKESVDSWATCIQVLREPNDEDLKNLSFRSTVNAADEEASELLDEDVDGDTLMRDLEVDMLDTTETPVDTPTNTEHAVDRIPPQWTPDRFLPNTIFHAAALGGVTGWDSRMLRDRVVGLFWRRPIESYIVRMMDDWERTQPIHLRHLATIRDQHMTSDKKFLHYVYRTYENFEKAVEARVAHWAGVSKALPKNSSQDPINHVMLDAWGFPIVNPEDLVRGSGSATLSEASSTLVNPHRYGPRWDNRLAQEIGYKKTQNSKMKSAGKSIPMPKIPNSTKPSSQTSLTPQQRVSLGLKPTGRLTKSVSAQIRAHRQKTGDPTSVPDKLDDEQMRIGPVPLMTAEDRIAAGLPPRGRLGKEKENQIREERGLPALLPKQEKSSRKFTKASRVLSDKQRIALGWIGHGRMPQGLVDGLRQEREDDIAPEDSEVILQYMEYMRAAKANKDAKSAPTEATEDQTEPPKDESRPTEDLRALLKSVFSSSATRDTTSSALASSAVTGKRKKRKAENGAISSPSSKRARSVVEEDSETTASSEEDEEPLSSSAHHETKATPSSRGRGRPRGRGAKALSAPTRKRKSLVSASPVPPADIGAPDRSGSCTKSVEPDEDRPGSATMTHAPDDTPREQFPPTTTEEEILPSVERQRKSIPEVENPAQASISVTPSVPRSLLHVVIQPDVSKLDPQARTAFDQYNNRSSPGLYINPYAKQKVPRGRPRKACILTFKLPQLSSYAWFVPETDQVQPTPIPQETSSESDKLSRAKNAEQADGDARLSLALNVSESMQAEKPASPSIETAIQAEDVVRDSHTPVPPEATLGVSEPTAEKPALPSIETTTQTEEVTGDSHTLAPLEAALIMSDPSPASNGDHTEQSIQSPPSVSTGPGPNGNPAATQGNSEPSLETETMVPVQLKEYPREAPPVQPLPPSVSAGPGLYDNPVASSENSEPSLGTGAVVPVQPREPPREAPPVPRMSTVWTAINGPIQRGSSSYKSPYAPNAYVEPTFPHQGPLPTTGTDASATTASAAGISTSGVDGKPSVSNGVHNVIGEARPPAAPGPRRKETGGSVMIFRREIILEIIDRCNGVFPDSAEIGRPFQTLWKARHGQLTAPSRNTVSDTLRAMAKNPEYGLKRWTFYVRNKSTPTMTRKTIIARVHLTPESPEVQSMVRNMANCARDKSHQYFPEGIHDILGEELEKSKPVARKNDSIILSQLNANAKAQIKETKKQQRIERREREKAERKARNAQVEQASSKQRALVDGVSHTKRARLASLNDKSKQLRRPPQDKARVNVATEADVSESDVAEATSPSKIPLVWMRPVVAPIPDRGFVSEEMSEAEESDIESEDSAPPSAEPPTTESASLKTTDKNMVARVESTTENSAVTGKEKKRVRIAEPRDRLARKKARLNTTVTASTQDTEDTRVSSAEEDDPYTSEGEEGSEEEEEAVRPKMTKKRASASSKRQLGKPGPSPTLLERLTGLTGDPNDPIYQPPQHRQRPRPTRPWRVKKRARSNRQKNEREYTNVADPVDKFKKLFCTFVVASSMSGEEGVVDWNLVKKVYDNDKFFGVASAQKLWAWMQSNMVVQVSELSAEFQSLFLEAYEAGRVSAIEDPDTYDWPNLVQWVVRKCTYPEIPLPMLREALRHFTVDESNYENLDRVSWYKAAVADRTRTLLQLQQSFTAPLHRSREATWSPEDKLLKARSWIRSNTATSQDLYDATLAHDKFKELGESVLVSVVGDLVQKQHLRMRKTKRLLPGRNYSFTKRLAKKYTRLFQLSDFLDAVEVKKNMDAAFESEDPAKRYYTVSRCEEDGSFAAIMNMVSEGTVKLSPQLPPINSEFGAPLPRISVWGFCEGDYIHRAIDRERLFWDIHVVPTATYRFGNPLQPLPAPPTDKNEPAVWPVLPDPPLPGKHNAGALLPIWSSIDGQSITWPWWYRILNLVLQPLIFIAGATAAEVHSHCPEDTVELFEVELVLGWLESIDAVKKTVGGGYITRPGFWASFGDRLLDTEDDWFGEHVKRKSKSHEKQEWRTEYNLRHSTLQAQNAEQTQTVSGEDAQDDANIQDVGAVEPSTGQEILKNPKRQYRITKEALDAQQTPGEKDKPVPVPTSTGSPVATQAQTRQDVVAEQPRENTSQTSETTNTPGQDIDMADVDTDADVDAEGEIDDDLY